MSHPHSSIIGYHRGHDGGRTFYAVDPSTGEAFGDPFAVSPLDDVEAAANLAAAAAPAFGALSGIERATFLRSAADKIAAAVEDLQDITPRETGLPAGRIAGETGRTVGQLRLFASLIEEGNWVDARIDRAQPDREPLPKPDVRSMLRPVGPVVVFGASNFPLAFSTAGGDTASALAAGNPVIVKAHPAHPNTALIVAKCVIQAAQDTGMPEGVFSLLFDDGYEVGSALVRHPAVKAVGFTGSRKGGRALMDLAAARPEPIPVFAEMSSINPMVLLPGAVAERGAAIAEGLAGSVTLGVGQFCTCPGLVLLEEDADGDSFVSQLAEALGAVAPAIMLTPGIAANFRTLTSSWEASSAIRSVTAIKHADENAAGPHLFEAAAADYLTNPEMAEEVFGPSTLVLRGTKDELQAVVDDLEGQLTTTLHAADSDQGVCAEWLALLERKTGRLVFNGFPTGVDVCHAMVHGGPWPATSDGRSTSVGTGAILRFARPVAWQGVPDALLPPELQEANPLEIQRTEN